MCSSDGATAMRRFRKPIEEVRISPQGGLLTKSDFKAKYGEWWETIWNEAQVIEAATTYECKGCVRMPVPEPCVDDNPCTVVVGGLGEAAAALNAWQVCRLQSQIADLLGKVFKLQQQLIECGGWAASAPGPCEGTWTSEPMKVQVRE